MTVSQISVFAESKPGHLSRVLSVFEEEHVSVRGFSASDTGEYGIVRFIVDDPEKGLAALQRKGFACTETPVLCLRLEDTPGELARVMGVLADCDINVIYSYSMISTYVVLSTNDVEQAEKLLSQQPVQLISQDDIKRIVADAEGVR